MPGQLPGQAEVFLDHVAYFVPAMEPAARALEGCGFMLTPFTIQTNRVNSNPVPAGTGNRCAMLCRGYVEILAATGDTPLARQLRDRLERHVGLHLAAFSSADAAGDHRRLAAAGFPVLPLVDMRRPVTTEDGEQHACFTIARVVAKAMPEGRIQFLTHHSENLVWREPYLEHPNGAQALLGLWIAAENPVEPADRFARFTGRPVRRERDVATISLDRGCLRFASPKYLEQHFGIAPGPPLPYLAANEIDVADFNRLRRVLGAAGIVTRSIPGGLAVTLPAAIGGTILFRAGSG